MFSAGRVTVGGGGQRFTVPSAPSLSLHRLPRKEEEFGEEDWEASGSPSLHILRTGNKLCTVMQTQTGGVGGAQVAPVVGFCYREAHCDEEEGGGRTPRGNNECTHKKGP